MLGLQLSNSGWHQNNRQQTLSKVSQTHILYSTAYFHLCAAFLFSRCSPAVSKGGRRERDRAAKVSFQDKRLNSQDIMSFSVATLPLAAAHLPPPQEPRLWVSVADCLPASVCVRMCLPSWGELRPGQNEVSLLFHFQEGRSLSVLALSHRSGWFCTDPCT